MTSVIEELQTLLLDWETGELDDAGIQKVRDLLRTAPEARAYFVRHQMINAALQLDVASGLESLDLAPSETASESSEVVARSAHVQSGSLADFPRRRRTWHVRYWAAAAAVLICVLAGRVLQLELFRPSDPPQAQLLDPALRDESEEPTSEGVALVTRLVDVVWSDQESPFEVGDALTPGRLAIDSGYAQIEFFCGATVVVEGPAELDLRSPTLARVRSGRLRAQVPPAARGFSLEVDDMTVVDLGTEFGLSVSPSGTNVQVFDGEVELQQPLKEKRLVTAGSGLLRGSNGEYSETALTPGQFLDIASLESRALDQRDQRFQRWSNWSHEFRRDDRLIAYYAFDAKGDGSRRLDSSGEPNNDELDGAIVGAGQVSGRWPSKAGLEFKRPGDRVRVQVPGEFQSLTFVCWAKIDSLDRWYNSLFLTDGYEPGEPHWQILDSGQMYFSVRPMEAPESTRRDFKALSPSFWKPSMSGKWMHFAVTCDLQSNVIVHYLNGRELSRHEVPSDQLPRITRIGTASIGNWSIPTRPDAEFAIRNLNGSVDEFAILQGALPADEIREIYKNGKP
ncbi:MAG: LamG-like jellyroll fold domain-containing protein [Planctomycetota bacterium]